MAEEVSRRPYVREMGWRWIFRHPRYVRYMLREFSCLFIGGYTLIMVWGLKELARGPGAWQAFLEWLRSPASVAFHLVALAFALYHSITWFNLTPKALPIPYISAMHYAGWAAVSAIVLLLAL